MAWADPALAEAAAKATADLYGDATADLIRIVARRLARSITDDGWATAKLLELLQLRADAEQVIARLQGAVVDTVADGIETAAAQGARAAATELQLTAPLATRVNTAAVEALARQTVGDLTGMHTQILRSVDDVYRRSVEAGRVVTGAATRRQAAQRMLDNFAHRGVTGFTTTRADGVVVRWTAESYAEMATRTAAGRAQVQGSLDQYVADDRNFVIVSDAPQECERCRPYEGKGLSLNGEGVGTTVGGIRIVDTFRGAQSKGLLHASCRHRVNPIIPGLTRPMKHTADPEGDALRQEQRRLERGVREWKRVEAAALDDQARARARAKVREWQGRLKTHVDTNNLKRQRSREQIRSAR